MFIIRSIIYSWKGVYDDENQDQKPIYRNFAIISLAGTAFIIWFIYYFYNIKALIIHSMMVLGAIVYL